ncbi:MAG: hypothetical protein M9913_02515 [Bryobacteraceae bacterium]|nr:hypothetical protein [Solibacteraceae bacterium]MCO5349775.1 hypothetical protein [Bryobacteraceae bacterium]
MERRFTIVLGDEQDRLVDWGSVFNEAREMPGHQTKYEHMRDRTYLRPRDFIKFANCALARYKERAGTPSESDHAEKIDNVDVHNARVEFSEYFLREIDDEVHKHMPDYEQQLDVLRALGKWQFELGEFQAAYVAQQPRAQISPIEILERLYQFSFIGFYRAGGRGFGGSEYMFRYREPRLRFDPTAGRFRIHPGLIEVMGLKRA